MCFSSFPPVKKVKKELEAASSLVLMRLHIQWVRISLFLRSSAAKWDSVSFGILGIFFSICAAEASTRFLFILENWQIVFKKRGGKNGAYCQKVRSSWSESYFFHKSTKNTGHFPPRSLHTQLLLNISFTYTFTCTHQFSLC